MRKPSPDSAPRLEPNDPPAFALGETVYMRMQPERFKGMVTGILTAGKEEPCHAPGKLQLPAPPPTLLLQRPPGPVFLVTWADGIERGHFQIELTPEFEPNYE